jgi:hypothetical protein
VDKLELLGVGPLKELFDGESWRRRGRCHGAGTGISRRPGRGRAWRG